MLSKLSTFSFLVLPRGQIHCEEVQEARSMVPVPALVLVSVGGRAAQIAWAFEERQEFRTSDDILRGPAVSDELVEGCAHCDHWRCSFHASTGHRGQARQDLLLRAFQDMDLHHSPFELPSVMDMKIHVYVPFSSVEREQVSIS